MTSYEVRISDWSSDVCSSDLTLGAPSGMRWILIGSLMEDLRRIREELGPAPELAAGAARLPHTRQVRGGGEVHIGWLGALRGSSCRRSASGDRQSGV